MDNQDKLFTGVIVIWLGGLLVSGAAAAGIVYVAWHFISKLW